jgi:hypothetical protein
MAKCHLAKCHDQNGQTMVKCHMEKCHWQTVKCHLEKSKLLKWQWPINQSMKGHWAKGQD